MDRIQGHINSLLRTYQNQQKHEGVTETHKAKERDSLELSQAAKELKTSGGDLKKSRELNSERVSQLKEAVKQGTYQVSGSQIADKMLEEIEACLDSEV